MHLVIEHRPPTTEEYLRLRSSTDWVPLSRELVERGLEQSVFSVCACTDDVVGMGRIVGDNSVYFYIQDVIVLPEYRGTGIGTRIMNEIEAYLDKHAGHNAFVGLMAAEGVAEFYKEFGYRKRSAKCPGMYKMIKRSG